jgi:signal transduction histidine kinase
MDFTTPYIEVSIVVATKVGVAFIDNLEQILDKKIGIVNGYSYNEKLKKRYPNIQIVEVDSIEDGLQKVENGTVFAYIDNSISINYEIQNNFVGTLAISGKLQDKLHLSTATRNDESILHDIFDTLILSMSIGDKQQILNKWVNVSYNNKIDYTLIWELVFIFIAILLFFLYKQVYIHKINKRLNHEIEKAILKSKEQDKFIFQQNRLASMGEMIENISHQWRQPLSEINSAVLIIDDELYQNKIKNNIIQEKLDEVESMTKYMSNTIDDFRNFYDKNKKEETFMLEASLNNVISLLSASFKFYTIQIDMNISKEIEINGFKNEFEQAILAILNNAKDVLILRKILNPKIEINLKITDTHHILTLCDNAGGIKEEYIHKIFDPYFTTKHATQGTGLGLYLSKKILEESIKSQLYVKNIKSGACFFIKFPQGDKHARL